MPLPNTPARYAEGVAAALQTSPDKFTGLPTFEEVLVRVKRGHLPGAHDERLGARVLRARPFRPRVHVVNCIELAQ